MRLYQYQLSENTSEYFSHNSLKDFVSSSVTLKSCKLALWGPATLAGLVIKSDGMSNWEASNFFSLTVGAVSITFSYGGYI